MKKRNFITGFSAAFVATIALVSCGGIRSKEGVVLTINGEPYYAKDLFGESKSAASAEAKFNAVYKAAVRNYFTHDQEGLNYKEDIARETKIKVEGAKDEAKSNASKNGTKYNVEWEKILKSNGVDDESGLYDKFEYEVQKSKFEDKFYDFRFEDKGGDGYETNYDVLRNGGYFRDKSGNPITKDSDGNALKPLNGYFNEKQPYHMKHILVRLSKAKQNGDDTNCLITKEEAHTIYNIVKELADGTEFEKVSDHWGDEKDSAKSNRGSLGIMSRDTSFVNDFKLGTYLYEAFYSSATSSGDGKSGTYLPTKASGKLFPDTEGGLIKGAGKYALDIAAMTDKGKNANEIGQIPYGEIMKLGYYDEVSGGMADIEEKDATKILFKDAGVDISKVKEKYLPRNVLFNKYFNRHNIMVITPTALSANDSSATDGEYFEYRTSKTDGYIKRSNKGNDSYSLEKNDTFEGMSGFKFEKLNEGRITKGYKAYKNDDEVTLNSGPTNKVLRDENGRVIFVFRSGSSSSKTSNDDSGYQGIHFVVIERSPFIGQEDDRSNDEIVKEKDTKFTTLNQYYTQYYPYQTGDDHHPKYADGKTYKKTYANYVTYEKDKTVLKKRADTVKSELKKADNNLNTYIYDYLLAKGSIKFTQTAIDLGIDQSIKNWITYTKRDNTDFEKTKSWNEAWHTYYNELAARQEARMKHEGQVEPLIPEVCARAFLTGGLAGVKIGSSTGDDVTLKQLFREDGGAFNA